MNALGVVRVAREAPDGYGHQVAVDARLGLVRDDGAVVYVNGQEAYRTNMPGGTVTATTPAASTTAGSSRPTAA